MKVLLLTLAVLHSVKVLGATAVSYQNTWDQGWRAAQDGDHCRMVLALPGYGEARFVADPETEMMFELQAMRDFQGEPLRVWRATPDWLPAAAVDASLGQMLHIRQGGSMAHGKLAKRMFLALRQGYGLELRGASKVAPPDDLSLQVAALDFFPAMQDFLACAHTAVTVAWQGISRTRVGFEVGAYKIDSSPRLDAVAQYVLNNPAVSQIYIDGYTDDAGETRANYQLAKRRAESVHAYLKSAGVVDREIVLRYHGERYPVASNDDPAGRAQNRRTTIRLARGDWREPT